MTRSEARSVAGLVLVLGLPLATWGCGSDAPGGGADIGADTTAALQPLGAPCGDDGDCISGECLESEYGVPFCTRPCTATEESCPEGPDAPAGSTLCVDFGSLPTPGVPAFKGELTRFCVPTCKDLGECAALGAAWEECGPASYLGELLYPQLGQGKRVCQAPSFQGKDPVDPALCDWDKTVAPGLGSEAVLCERYCEYLAICKEIPADTPGACCAWGCFNRMVVAGEVVDAWHDEVKCYVQTHAAFPRQGTANGCSEPPRSCGGPPDDPTPPGAGGGL